MTALRPVCARNGCGSPARFPAAEGPRHGLGAGPALPLPCRRIPLEQVPEDEDQCSAWLHRLYQEKVSARAPAPFLAVLGVHGCSVGARGPLELVASFAIG